MTVHGKVVYDIVGQAAHGVCAVGNNPWDAYEHIERLEHICEIVLKSGVKPKK
jgi:L-fuculose-phosphate aldolase